MTVGTTTTVPVSLDLGALEETVTVTSEAPLIDVTSKQIGGNLTTEDLTQLPSISRNWLGFAALLPGIIQVPNLASWGSETISANGVDTRNNSFLVDGAWDNDDYLGQNNGGQVRVPIEGVQESQILIGQYDAEFGRTSGAIVNAVTKSGTNQLHGAGFMFYTNKAMRAEDYFVSQNDLDEPDPTKREWGGAIGGPVIRDKAHFFGNIERVSINEGRTIQIPPRPDLNWATVTEVRAWNALLRFDHQINANHSWSVRWLGEWSPQTGQTNNLAITPEGRQREWDLDQHSNVAFNSVLGRNIVNQFRFGWTREDDRFAQNDFSDCPGGGFDACSDQNLLEQQNVGANISYLTFLDGPRNVGTHWITNSPEISETLSWFIPDKKGDHDLKFGAKYYFTEWRFQNHAQINGQFVIPSNGPFNAADPRTYPERLTIQVPADFRVLMKQRAWAIFAQDKWRVNQNLTLNLGVRYDLERRRSTSRPTPTSAGDGTTRSTPTTSRRGRRDLHLGRGAVAAPLGVGPVLRQGQLRHGGGLRPQRHRLELLRRPVPARPDRSRAAGRQFPTDPMLVNGPVVNRALLDQLYPSGQAVRNTGVVWLDQPGRHMPSIQQVSLGYQRQLGARMSVSADYVHTYGRELFMQENLNPGVRTTTAAGADRPRRIRSSSPTSTPAPTSASTTTTGSTSSSRSGIEPLERPVSVHAVVLARQHQRRVHGADPVPVPRRPQPGGQPGPDRSRPAAQPGDQRPRRSAAHVRHDPGRDAADDERPAVHHPQHVHRPGPQRRPLRSSAGGGRRERRQCDHGGQRRRPQRRLRAGLHPARHALRLAVAACVGPDPGPVARHDRPDQPRRTS